MPRFAKLLLLFSSLVFSDPLSWVRPQPIPAPKDNILSHERIELGKLLFFDKRLSRDDTLSCASCHIPEKGWSDGRSKAIGHAGAQGKRNTPTIVNGAYLSYYDWDGRAVSLEEQSVGPMGSTVEMNLPIEEVAHKLSLISGYRLLFESAYPGEGITPSSIAKAIASFERTVVSDNAPFDRWIRGERDAISDTAQEGFALFNTKGKCHKCHNGFNFTNESFNAIGLGDTDQGRYELEHSRIWRGAFKSPTLREVALTSPYFHDGSVHTLEEAVHICGNGGRYPDARRSAFLMDRELTKDEIRRIVAFLETLTSSLAPTESPKTFPR